MDSDDRKTTGAETLRQVGAGAAGCLMAGSGTCGGVSVLAGLFNEDQTGRFFEIVWGGMLLVVFGILFLARIALARQHAGREPSSITSVREKPE